MKISHVNFSCPTPVATPDGPYERNSVRATRDYLGVWTTELDYPRRVVLITCTNGTETTTTHVPFEAVASFFYSPSEEADE